MRSRAVVAVAIATGLTVAGCSTGTSDYPPTEPLLTEKVAPTTETTTPGIGLPDPVK
ncbi:hypothetical protein I6I68_04035 [Corynebacterium glucuronolyticum]|uniref:hypothetical protein n=1 Tax=Corynebacterium glucuronolyticum TaxID=39791 RepID=UPI00191D1BD0|nr:hypothetical protein [Corynebacterium glucuronolyticum]QQU89796.1 hypothetical protein I6I68_04035 [Corynebacterium glucuronolyticum]